MIYRAKLLRCLGSRSYILTDWVSLYARFCHINHLVTSVFVSCPAESGGKWTKGKNGATCEQTCRLTGRSCDASAQSALTTNKAIDEAFKQAGYTCKGFHPPRDYPGTPFSTGRNDDCAPMKAGKKSSCSQNIDGGHAPLCYCVRNRECCID